MLDESALHALARAARATPPRLGDYLPDNPAHFTREERLLVWFVTTGICQQTRALEGTVENRWFRGSDYLTRRAFAHLREHPGFWHPSHLANVTTDQLAAAISDTGRAQDSTLDRCEERARMTREMGAWMADKPWWSAKESHAVATIAEPLRRLEAYADPLQKKTYLLLGTLVRAGLLHLADPGSMELPVDYHVMRVLLRTGSVVVPHDLAEKLATKTPCTDYEEEAVRRACIVAGRWLVEHGTDLFDLDALLWSVGRNCCREDAAPLCGGTGTCPKKAGDRCSLIQGFAYECPDACPLAEGCSTARGKANSLLHAPVFETHFY